MRDGPPHPRPKKPSSPQCMKLLISYGGSFGDPRPPTTQAAGNGKLRYAGGETRIISVHRRGLDLPKLLARISEVLPGVLLPLPADHPSLCLCHQLLWAPDRREDGESGGREPPLVPISGDEDVARMLEEHDRLTAQGKAARLRMFLCDEEPASGVGSSELDALAVRSGESRVRRGVSPRGSALLEKGTAKNRGCDARDSGEAVAHSAQTTTGYAPGTRCFGHPSNPNVLQSNGTGTPDCGNFRKPIAKKDMVYGVKLDQPVGDSPFLRQLRNPETSGVSGAKNRENVVPWTAGYCIAETSPLVPVHNQTNRVASALKSVQGNTSSTPLSTFRISHMAGSDVRHVRGPYDAQTHRGGVHERGIRQANVLDGKFCSGKWYPGLRPRSSIAKSGQARLSMYQGKLFDAGNGRGSLNERDMQTSVERKMASQLHLQGVLPCIELGRNLAAGHTDNNLPYLPPELSKNPARYALNGTPNKDPSCFPKIEQCVAQAQILCNSDHLTHPLECPVVCVSDPHQPRITINELNCLERESLLMQIETGSNVEASSSKLYSSSNVKIDETKCANIDSFYPPTTQLHPIHLAAKVADIKDPFANNSDVTLPLDVSVHNLWVSSSTKACLPAHCSHTNSGGLDPATSGVTESLPASEVGPCLNQVVVMEDDTLGMQSATRKLARETDCKASCGISCISVDDAIGSQLLQKIPKPSSLLTTQSSLAIGNDFAHRHKDQTVSSTSNVEVKVNTEQTILISPEAVPDETSTKLPLVYSQLATQGMQIIKDTDLEEIRELGSGTYGTVFYGKWKGSDVAIKRLKPNCFSGGGSAKDRLIADFWKEAHLLGQLHHPNVVAFYGVTDGEGTSLATVTEYMVNGSLKQVLRRKDRTIDRRKRLIIAMDAAFGMQYLHEKNVVHFDLKSHNFLVNMRDPQRPVCKIGDLGLSKVKRRTLVSGGVRGTIPWMAPELLASKNSMVTEKVDVYSFGIVMWEILTGEEPYGDMPSEKVIAGIIKGNLRPEIPTWCDPAWRSLMERCWASDPCSRPAFSEIAKELRAIAASMNIL